MNLKKKVVLNMFYFGSHFAKYASQYLLKLHSLFEQNNKTFPTAEINLSL